MWSQPGSKLLVGSKSTQPSYTGEATLTSIQHFLSGYNLATDLYDVADPKDQLLIPLEFHDWVAYRLHFYESGALDAHLPSECPVLAQLIEAWPTLPEETRGAIRDLVTAHIK